MYMVPPSIWELVKKCVNEHEKKILDNLNNESSIHKDPTKSNITTSSLIHDISSKDITPLEPSMSSDLNLSRPLHPEAPQDEIDLEPSQTSFHRSQDRSRSFLNPNISHSSMNLSQIPLPQDSFDESSHNPANMNMSQHSNRSKINLSQPAFNMSDSFGHLPQNFPPESDESYGNFLPRQTSTPILPEPNNPIPIPIPKLAICRNNLPRSPIKTRTRTGALPTAEPVIGLNNCIYCGKRFARRWNLKKHINMIHLQNVAPDPDQPVITSSKRKEQTDFNQPLFVKSRRSSNFDKWNLNN